eukprot:TRINITY_DN67949_c5_g4_i2.p1 TRINITY_DN67949_c5_g4~~TRINITY_DN67949_c5_g4_i2.p1  ORF type:complete len:249 (-),score=13.92 TRINITY_DN67949_c5_g4_i2:73-819(-)
MALSFWRRSSSVSVLQQLFNCTDSRFISEHTKNGKQSITVTSWELRHSEKGHTVHLLPIIQYATPLFFQDVWETLKTVDMALVEGFPVPGAKLDTDKPILSHEVLHTLMNNPSRKPRVSWEAPRDPELLKSLHDTMKKLVEAKATGSRLQQKLSELKLVRLQNQMQAKRAAQLIEAIRVLTYERPRSKIGILYNVHSMPPIYSEVLSLGYRSVSQKTCTALADEHHIKLYRAAFKTVDGDFAAAPRTP